MERERIWTTEKLEGVSFGETFKLQGRMVTYWGFDYYDWMPILWADKI